MYIINPTASHSLFLKCQNWTLEMEKSNHLGVPKCNSKSSLSPSKGADFLAFIFNILMKFAMVFYFPNLLVTLLVCKSWKDMLQQLREVMVILVTSNSSSMIELVFNAIRRKLSTLFWKTFQAHWSMRGLFIENCVKRKRHLLFIRKPLSLVTWNSWMQCLVLLC